MNQQIRKHIFILYALTFIAFSIALGAAFGQRSDYLRLNMLGAPQVTPGELFFPPTGAKPFDERWPASAG